MKRPMTIVYTFDVAVEGQLGPNDIEELRDALESEASSVLCDIRGGDSGEVGVRYAPRG